MINSNHFWPLIFLSILSAQVNFNTTRDTLTNSSVHQVCGNQTNRSQINKLKSINNLLCQYQLLLFCSVYFHQHIISLRDVTLQAAGIMLQVISMYQTLQCLEIDAGYWKLCANNFK